jgi:hypothetical protein
VAYVDQTYLESLFGADRVAQVFSVIGVDGTTTGTVDSARLATCIAAASAEFDGLMLGAYPEGWTGTVPDAIKRWVGIFTMHTGMLARPEYSTARREQVPYFTDWMQARADVKEVRQGLQRVTVDRVPAQFSHTGVTTTAPIASVFNASDGSAMRGY